ncbi:MAG: transporter [Planctomycetales bacterium]|nr:transporter [Planctomycetales bacterium]
MTSPLSPVDWLIVAFYFAGVMAVGFFASRGSNSSEGFLLGDRGMSWWMLLFSIVATETSTVTFLSLPGEAYKTGGNMTFLQLTLGYILGRMIVIWVLLPQYYAGSFFTAYEVLQQRFGGSVRKLSSAIFLVMRTLADGLRLLLTGLLIEWATGLSLTTCVVLIAASTTLYSAVGGVRSVVLNDFLQFIAYMIGAVAALFVLLSLSPGGAAGAWEFAASTGRLRVLDFSASLTSPTITLMAGVIGGAALSMASHGADHLMVQRYLCARSQRQASIALGLSGPLVALQFALFLVIGAALAYFYEATPVAYTIDRSDRAFIGFIVHELSPGLRGAVVAAVLAASMSTLSSSLNASAGVLVKDWGFLLPNDPTHSQTVLAARWATALFAVLQSMVAIAAFRVAVGASIINGVLAIAAFSTGILLGLFLLGIVRQRSSETAGIAGLAAGGAVCSWVAFGTSVSWPWLSLIGSATTFVVGYAFAAVVPPSEEAAWEG